MVEVPPTKKSQEIPKPKNCWDWIFASYKGVSHIRGVCGFF